MDKIEFTGAQGDTLAARLDMPESNKEGVAPQAYALFAHCFTCGKDILAASRIAQTLNKHNIAVLRFDFTGLGMSEGEFANTNFTSNVQDLVKAYEFMDKIMQAPKLLIGHSLGGTACLAAAQHMDGVKAVVTIGSPCSTGHVADNFKEDVDKILKDGFAEVCLAGRPFTIKKQFIEDIRSQKMDENIKNIRRALLIMHAPHDETVGIENAAHIFTQAKHPKSFISLDDANHLLTKKGNARYAADVIAAWCQKYTN